MTNLHVRNIETSDGPASPTLGRKLRDWLAQVVQGASLCVGMVAPAQAATLGDMLQAFALPVESRQALADWKGFDQIPGFKWRDASLRSGAPMDPKGFMRIGEVSVNGIGPASVLARGPREGVTGISVGGDGKSFNPGALVKYFGNGAMIKQVRDGCKDGEGAMRSTSVYSISVPSRKPVFVHIETGSSNKGDMSVTFDFSHRYSAAFRCTS